MGDRKIIISGGDKGGVGKSMNSAIFIEAALAIDTKVALVEGDPTQPDVGWRYINEPGVEISPISLYAAGDSANTIVELGEYIERTAAKKTS